MDKVLVNITIPATESNFDMWIPINKKVVSIILLIVKGLNLEGIETEKLPMLYNRATGKLYDINLTIKETDIKNATELILI